MGRPRCRDRDRGPSCRDGLRDTLRRERILEHPPVPGLRRRRRRACGRVDGRPPTRRGGDRAGAGRRGGDAPWLGRSARRPYRLASSGQFGDSADPDPVGVTRLLAGLGGGLRYLLARTPGFDLAHLEKSDGLLVELCFSTRVLTTLEAYFLIVTDFLHHHEATRWGPSSGYRSATSR